jgi:transcriptional regulator with XRE-family HTH domain
LPFHYENSNMATAKRKQVSKLGVTLGRNISEKRKEIGWTQADLAEQIGVDTETISRFERGSNMPSLLRLERLAAALDMPLSGLIAASSSHTHDQAQKISEWISELKENDRDLVLKMLKQLCAHLVHRK